MGKKVFRCIGYSILIADAVVIVYCIVVRYFGASFWGLIGSMVTLGVSMFPDNDGV